jgi:hypothetical protein
MSMPNFNEYSETPFVSSLSIRCRRGRRGLSLNRGDEVRTRVEIRNRGPHRQRKKIQMWMALGKIPDITYKKTAEIVF